MTDFYKHRIDCQTCGIINEDFYRTSILTECPNNSEHTVNEFTFLDVRYAIPPTDTDGAVLSPPKQAPIGWTIQHRFVEFYTAKKDSLEGVQ